MGDNVANEQELWEYKPNNFRFFVGTPEQIRDTLRYYRNERGIDMGDPDTVKIKRVEERPICCAFPIKSPRKDYLLIWTTTPWTLPGNTGVMVNPDYEYAEVELETENGKEIWIMAKDKFNVSRIISAIAISSIIIII